MKYKIRLIKDPTKIKDLEIPMSEVDEWKTKNPRWEIIIGAPLIHSGGGLGLKSARTDEHFKDKLREIDKQHPRNTLKDFVNI